MVDFDIILQTDQIILRPLISDDYKSFIKLTGDKSMWIYFTSDLADKTVLKNWTDNSILDIKNRKRLVLESWLANFFPHHIKEWSLFFFHTF